MHHVNAIDRLLSAPTYAEAKTIAEIVAALEAEASREEAPTDDGPCCAYHETGGPSFDECADINAAGGDDEEEPEDDDDPNAPAYTEDDAIEDRIQAEREDPDLFYPAD